MAKRRLSSSLRYTFKSLIEDKGKQRKTKNRDGYLLEMFRHELSNHEYGYTRDAEPALKALGICWEDIGDDERLLNAFETACWQEMEWYDEHCGV